MATEPLIVPKTAAETQLLDTGNYPSVTIMASNLGAGEYVDVFILDPNGTVVDPLSWDSRAHALDDTNAAVSVPGGAVYSITKSVTVASTGVSWSPSKFY